MNKKIEQIYTREQLYRAHLTRDYRFDGTFFVAVKTTHIYCRPVCPARKAKLENLQFYTFAHEAEEAGFRPCIRCRPESAPGSPAWIGTSATIKRAVRLMESQPSEPDSISQLASQLGISERWFRQLFQQELGTSPKQYLLDKQLHLARNMLINTNTSITNIAFQCGFKSIRRFNDAFNKKFSKAPSHFKKKTTDSTATHTLLLRYRPPIHWPKIMQFFANRALTGMELVTDNSYERLIHYHGVRGWFKASLADNHQIRIDYQLEQPMPMLEFATKIKELFDLDADPMLIDQQLREDKTLIPLLDKHQGLRIPGCWNPFELAVRAITGQLISVKAAKSILNRLVQHCGERQQLISNSSLTYFFPTPQQILDSDLNGIGLSQSKINTINSLAQALVDGHLKLDGTEDYPTTSKKLLAIKGIGPWTEQYIAMRALRNPDAFPEKDLELQKQIKARNLNPMLWQPWRAYVTILLFQTELNS